MAGTQRSTRFPRIMIVGAVFVIALVFVSLALMTYDASEAEHEEPAPPRQVERPSDDPEVTEPSPELEGLPERERPPEPEVLPERGPSPQPYPPPEP